MDKKKKHKLPKDILELIKERNSLFKKSQEIIRGSNTIMRIPYQNISKTIDSFKKIFREFFKHHVKKSPETKNAYHNLETNRGIQEAHKIYSELHDFTKAHSISKTHLPKPKFIKNKSYHPKKILRWYFKAKRAVLLLYFEMLEDHTPNPNSTDETYMTIMTKALTLDKTIRGHIKKLHKH